MTKDSSYYNNEVAKLQKKVQLNPRDLESWEAMISLANEAIANNIDTERWQKAEKIMKQQYELMCF